MREGVRFADPSRVDIRGSVSAGMDVEVDVDVDQWIFDRKEASLMEVL